MIEIEENRVSAAKFTFDATNRMTYVVTGKELHGIRIMGFCLRLRSWRKVQIPLTLRVKSSICWI